MFWFGCAAMAEDPIVVHYSDPSLVRLEKQVGITPAQRDRFDDIVVKYRDPANNVAASNGNENDTASSDDQKRKHGRAGRKGTFGGVSEIYRVRNWLSWRRFSLQNRLRSLRISAARKERGKSKRTADDGERQIYRKG
jgi:hypothetical protein